MWRDLLLFGALIAAAALEGFARPDLVRRPFTAVIQIGLIALLLWRKAQRELEMERTLNSHA